MKADKSFWVGGKHKKHREKLFAHCNMKIWFFSKNTSRLIVRYRLKLRGDKWSPIQLARQIWLYYHTPETWQNTLILWLYHRVNAKYISCNCRENKAERYTVICHFLLCQSTVSFGHESCLIYYIVLDYQYQLIAFLQQIY